MSALDAINEDIKVLRQKRRSLDEQIVRLERAKALLDVEQRVQQPRRSISRGEVPQRHAKATVDEQQQLLAVMVGEKVPRDRKWLAKTSRLPLHRVSPVLAELVKKDQAIQTNAPKVKGTLWASVPLHAELRLHAGNGAIEPPKRRRERQTA